MRSAPGELAGLIDIANVLLGRPGSIAVIWDEDLSADVSTVLFEKEEQGQRILHCH